MLNEVRALVQDKLGLNESTEAVTEAVEENPFLNDDIILGYESSYPSFDEFVEMLEGTTSYDDRTGVADRDDLEESGNAPKEEKDEDEYLKSIDYYEDGDDDFELDLSEAAKDDEEPEDDEEEDSAGEAEEDEVSVSEEDDDDGSPDEADEEDEVVDDEEPEDEGDSDGDSKDSEDEGLGDLDLDVDSKVDPPDDEEDTGAGEPEEEDIGDEDLGDDSDEGEEDIDTMDIGDSPSAPEEPDDAPLSDGDIGDMSIDPDDIGFITNVSLDLSTNTLSDLVPVPPRNADTTIAEESYELPGADEYSDYYEEVSLFEAILGSDNTSNDSGGEKKDDNSITSAVKDKVNEAESNSSDSGDGGSGSSDSDSGSSSEDSDLPSSVDMDDIDGDAGDEDAGYEDESEGDSDTGDDSAGGDIGDEDIGGDEPDDNQVSAVSNALDQLSKVDTSLNDAKKALLKTLTQ